jgi:hypothetical protein
MENTNDGKLSFPQRNWLLLCIVVAVLSPLVVHWVRAGAHRRAYQQSVDIKPAGSTPSGGTDTSYKVASPPGADSAGAKK